VSADRAQVIPVPHPRQIMLIAGEASGDMHAADFLAALRERVPDIEVYGIGGARLRAAGMTTIADAGDTGTVGLTEGAGTLRTLVRAYRLLRERLRRQPPDLCVLVDFPEFNLFLARSVKRAGVPVLYYIAPQVWAWRQGRVKKIARRVDRLAVVFPFEPKLYTAHFPGVEFVGHPLLDRVQATRDAAATRTLYGLDPDRPLVALLPGSRATEIQYLLPAMLDAVGRLAVNGTRQFALALAPTVDRAAIEAMIATQPVPIRLVEADTYNLVAAADVAVVTSGTATLECALLECPMVIVYRTSALTAFLARRLVRGVRHIGMPNIVAERQIVPELIQGDASGTRIAEATVALLTDPTRVATMRRDLREIRHRLGRGGAAGRAADMAVQLLAGR
jgi:lipid-A-disaccharide synthase